jgi:hypothetical protein
VGGAEIMACGVGRRWCAINSWRKWTSRLGELSTLRAKNFGLCEGKTIAVCLISASFSRNNQKTMTSGIPYSGTFLPLFFSKKKSGDKSIGRAKVPASQGSRKIGRTKSGENGHTAVLVLHF